jgi:hypothetical protein
MLALVPDRSFDGRFFESHALFWPLAPAASRFADERDWPPVETYERAFSDPATAPVRFEAAPPPRGRRRTTPIDPQRLYDARITRERCVPTRPRSWHDFLNALVWATFPRAKLALHQRQHRALVERIPPGARTLPATRSREHDTLALIDEGGVVLLDDGRARESVLFGHALYEGLVLGRGTMTACAIHAPERPMLTDARARVALADEVLADHLASAALDPGSLDRVRIESSSAAEGETSTGLRGPEGVRRTAR